MSKDNKIFFDSCVTIKDVFYEVLYQAIYVRCFTLSGSNTTMSHVKRHSLLSVLNSLTR